jgi:hypothetical protein
MDRFFGGPALTILLRLIIASIAVGLLLALFGIQPIDLWRDFLDTVMRIWHMGFDAIDWAVRYFLLGAVVVIPIWLAVRIWTYLVERK